MAVYAIGDVQGCLSSLDRLLSQIDYQTQRDVLWFAGDIVNRGSHSLETIRFIRSLPSTTQVVLGNHDLHLIATYVNGTEPYPKDTFHDILAANDCDDLMGWLIQRPLLIYDDTLDYCLTHAGIPPFWSLKKARKLATELETVLRSDEITRYAETMYGDKPGGWSKGLEGTVRWRLITNYFTRMRFLDENGNLELKTKSGISTPPPGCRPWFSYPGKATKKTRLLFGHWAAINGVTNHPRIFALDTGCVWGGQLCALRLDDQKRFSCDC